PNGAGKTTTLKILSGVLYPTAGKARVAGHIPWRREEEFLKKITLVMGQKNQLLWELPAMDSFLLNRAIYEIPKVEFKQTLEELVSLLEVEQLLTTPVRKLSLGQRMRLELVATLLHRPRILFLDEPTIGLDVVAAQNIREFITAYNKKTGATVLLTSHYMGDIAKLASRVCIINEGRLIFEGSLAKIVERWVNEKVIRALLTNEPNMQELSEIGEVISYQFPRVEIRIPRAAAPGAAARLLQNFSVADVTIEEPPIEEVIRKIFTNTLPAGRQA
ncbi:ATP-binding cassette domain-containing protein, partial [Candidatus Microgenomates bacterium]|nr:ATP-binding cassette domain-containing protein [Candidatus Microgenomates bacterium]